MGNEHLREEIIVRAAEYLRRDSTGKGYVCPICQDGDGHTGKSGITTKDGEHYTCWRGCFTNATIIDIIALEKGGIAIENRSRYPEKLQIAAEVLGIDTGKRDTTPHHTTPQPAAKKAEQEKELDYSAFFAAAAEHIHDTDYWQRRGLSQCIVERFGLGFVADWRHPKAPNAPTSPRLIIPTGKGSYLARDTREDLTEKERQYSKSKVGTTQLYNLEALGADCPIFVVEGEIDAISLTDAGAEAVALGSTAMKNKFIKHIKAHPPKQPLFLALDRDQAGEETTADIVAALSGIVEVYPVDIYGEYKDANERLQKDPRGLVYAVKQAVEGYEQHKEDEREAYRKKNSTAAYINDFLKDIVENRKTPALSTGFQTLDKELEGGLYSGLYCIGAVSTLGKTTLLLQIADNIAASGKDVLIISLEMARSELMAKSISRITLQEQMEKGGNLERAQNTRAILTGLFHAEHREEEQELLRRSIVRYAEYADHIFILEGMGNLGVAEIREAVETHRNNTGNTPVVVVDYLQILAPADPRSSDKQNTDKAVLELKRISRDYSTPVLAISALNRENYSNAINMAAFKESGAIEYGSDVLIGLQYAGAGEKIFNLEEAIQSDPRQIELKILKNRNGKARATVKLEYYPRYNYFREEH